MTNSSSNKRKRTTATTATQNERGTTALAGILEESPTITRTHQTTTSSQSSSYRPSLQTGPTTDDSHATIIEGGVTNTIEEYS